MIFGRALLQAIAVGLVAAGTQVACRTIPDEAALLRALSRSPELNSEQEWDAFVARAPLGQRPALQDARVQGLMSTIPNKFLETKKAFLLEIEHRLRAGAVPRALGEQKFSWPAVQRLLESLPGRSDQEYAASVGRVLVEQLLPLAPADEPPPSNERFLWNSFSDLPERDAIRALEALQRRFGRLVPSTESRPVGHAIEANASFAVIQALIRTGVTTQGDWDPAVRAARVDVLNELRAADMPIPGDALVAATWAVEKSGKFESLDWLIDAMPRPLPARAADIALGNLLTQARQVPFDEKWPRIDRLLAHGADLTRASTDASSGSERAVALILLMRREPEVAKALLDRGLDPGASMPPRGDNLLLNYLALPDRTDPRYTKVRAEVVAAIVKRRDLLNRYSPRLQTFPLYLALALDPSKKLGQALIGLGADPRVRDPAGRSLLMLAAGLGDAGVANFLIKAGADLATVDRYGVSALGYAQCHQEKTIVALLEAAGAPSLGRAECEATPGKIPGIEAPWSF